MPSWDDDTRYAAFHALIERCRELYDPWMKLKEREVQLSLLDTPLHATVEADSTPSLKKQ